MFPKYKSLIIYHLAQKICNLNYQFCLNYLDKDEPKINQMIEKAYSIKDNIIEKVSKIASLKDQIKLLEVACAFVQKLITDYEDFLRKNNLKIYSKPASKMKIFHQLDFSPTYLINLNYLRNLRKKSILPPSAEVEANFLLTLCRQLSYLLSRQIKKNQTKFIQNGNYWEFFFPSRFFKSFKLPNSSQSFSLIELLIVIALIALLTTAALVLFNPRLQIDKASDSKRKSEINTLKKIFEDFYNDKNRYPLASEICYDTNSPQSRIDSYGKTACSCKICGNKAFFRNFSPYLNKLPCDPKSPQKDYLYDYDCSNNNNPQWFRIYTNLDSSDFTNNDKETIEVGCYYQSCGPPPSYGYDYGVTSNSDLERYQNFSFCSVSGCNFCGSYQNCQNIASTNQFCQNKRLTIPAAICGRENCPCQP